MNKETIKVKGMFCPHCEVTVSKALRELDGVEEASASFQNSEAVVIYDPSKVTMEQMHQAIIAEGYEIGGASNVVQIVSILAILISFYVIARQQGWTNVFNLFPTIETGMELGMLFVVGLMTSIHCIAMCGGINLTQATASSNSKSRLMPNLLYNLGRVISYTLTGAICGAVGQTIGFSGKLRGILPVIVGAAMLFMALNMLGFFRKIRLRRLRIRLPKAFYAWAVGSGRGRSSLVIGLLNGLMPCGPLQSMQIYALGTGSILTGALSMLLFSLGTVPLMFGFGFIAGKLNQKYRKYMLSISAIIIFVMGVHMISDGLAVSGVSVSGLTVASTNKANVQTAMLTEDGDVQQVRTEIDYGAYPPIKVKAGVPVKWNIYVPEGKLNGCNGEILIRDFDVDIKLQEGDNFVEFTPDEAGTFAFSCWMGMIRSTIEVVE